MARIMEVFVIVNAACGIVAFLIAKGLAKKGVKKVEDLFREEEPKV